MSRRKNRSKDSRQKESNPFASLKSLVDEEETIRQRWGYVEKKEIIQVEEKKEAPSSMEELFPGVKPVENENYVPVKPGRNNPPQIKHVYFEELISENLYFDIEFLDEYVSASTRELDPVIMRRLKNGEYSFQGHLDLHGYGWEDSRNMVIEYIENAFNSSIRCVLIVHGRGLHSEGDEPVIKKNLISLLTRGPLKRKILAFTSALPVDGGVGAMYILLRRHR
ncbi:MAG: Smr/MutS family protein [Deltaproteobacteria bacterium]|nr:Smr/MutS family protein [Deltaproteobacteria bacterium]